MMSVVSVSEILVGGSKRVDRLPKTEDARFRIARLVED